MNNVVTFHDPERVEDTRLSGSTAQIARGELSALQAQFKAAGADGPLVIWNPKPTDLTSQQLHFLLAHWTRLKGARPFPLRSQIDPLEMRPALGYINLMEPIDGGRDFRFRLFGSTIASIAEMDLTGDLLSDAPVAAYLVEFELALHRAALARRIPVYASLTPPSSVSHATWHKLVLPLGDEAGAVTRFMTGVVPVLHKDRLEG